MNPPDPGPPPDEFLSQHPEIRAVDLLVADTNGVLRGKRIDRAGLPKVYQEGVCLPGSLFGMDITGRTVEATGLGFDEGDADRLCRPVPGTLSVTPWHRRPMAQLLMTMYEADGRPFFADPRQVLARVAQEFATLGLRAVVAVEMEFYLIDRSRAADGGPQPPLSPVTGARENATQVYGISELDDYSAFLEDLASAAELQGIPADAAVAEYAPGQYEINLHHETDALRACDHAVLLKRLIKGMAQRHDMEATFMAKPYDHLAGSGMHVHLSLVDDAGRNAFLGEEALLHHAVAGLAATMAEAMALFAPNANSFRRFRVGSFVPMSPTWGYNNRTTALRIPAGSEQSRRIEHRVAGADANPYLLVAALLAGVHHGIACKLDPAPPVTGNAYDQHAPSLPHTWLQALTTFERGTVLRDYLGAEFCRVYIASKSAERAEFTYHVSALEYQWYLRTV